MPPPSLNVVSAFAGGSQPPKGTPFNLLSNGPVPVYQVGRLLLKYVEKDDEEEAEWTSEVFEKLEGEEPGGFRVPKPIRSANNGKFVDNSWKAFIYIPDYQTQSRDWDEVLGAATRFHEVVKQLPCPPWLQRRIHPWAIADRVAWEEQEATMSHDALQQCYLQLHHIRRPELGGNSKWNRQIIHPDCSGNILFPYHSHGDEDPLIIDFSPYFRPALYAEAIILVDAYLWYGQTLYDIDELTDVEEPNMLQMLIRAAMFRLISASELLKKGQDLREAEAERFVDLCQWLEGKLKKTLAEG